MEERIRDDEIEIDLGEILHTLWRKAWLIVLCLVAGAVLTGICTKLFVVPQYSSSAMIYVLTKTTSVTSLADIQMGTQLTVDFETLATSRPVVEQVIEELNLNGTYEELVKTIKIDNPPNTRILKITVDNPNPTLAKDIANAMVESTADRVAEVMSTDKPSIVEEAVVSKFPSSPKTMRNIAIGGALGMMLAVGVIIVLLLIDDTIKSEEDIKRYLNLNTLAAIPLDELETSGKKRSSKKKKLTMRNAKKHSKSQKSA